jgi:hypothetical protein
MSASSYESSVGNYSNTYTNTAGSSAPKTYAPSSGSSANKPIQIKPIPYDTDTLVDMEARKRANYKLSDGTTIIPLGSGPQIAGTPTPKLMERFKDWLRDHRGKYGDGNICHDMAERLRQYLAEFDYLTSFSVMSQIVSIKNPSDTVYQLLKSQIIAERKGMFPWSNHYIIIKIPTHAVTDVHLASGTVWLDPVEKKEITDDLDQDKDDIAGEPEEPTDEGKKEFNDARDAAMNGAQNNQFEEGKLIGNLVEVFKDKAFAAQFYPAFPDTCPPGVSPE